MSKFFRFFGLGFSIFETLDPGFVQAKGNVG